MLKSVKFSLKSSASIFEKSYTQKQRNKHCNKIYNYVCYLIVEEILGLLISSQNFTYKRIVLENLSENTIVQL